VVLVSVHSLTGAKVSKSLESVNRKSVKESNFPKRLRDARLLLRMTQEELAAKWGYSHGNYIYMLESGEKKFPKKLESRVMELEREVQTKFYPSHQAGFGMILTDENLLPAEKELIHKAPVVSWASAGLGGDYNDLATFLDEYVETDCKDPNKYALIVDGDSMEPEARPGDRIIVAPNLEPENGDLVVARLAETGKVLFKLFHRTGKDGVRLTSYNPAYPVQDFKLTDFRFIQPVYQITRKKKGRK
jgi:SOS-response transcriptional repressor LexA